jgi:hypothetical protein
VAKYKDYGPTKAGAVSYGQVLALYQEEEDSERRDGVVKGAGLVLSLLVSGLLWAALILAVVKLATHLN